MRWQLVWQGAVCFGAVDVRGDLRDGWSHHFNKQTIGYAASQVTFGFDRGSPSVACDT